ncbi:cobalamin-independent methionine synthase II family protein [Candidatus Nephthysia bennettiae]|uniref:Cobalamin-independent methionine synthase II family protein n=1 Tax=Candidatus Nephthysia bennettiae TaxID=3127016 RepID=A0A934KBS5_9BACT|nr:cobalamin-independent methionine synthase II family protein [Candidatus Dormibacteraeota bacterium]MBJ7614046.1 cobalamin-independent methionine synthase II family protein [Candidatus Dormibacteraeota bacterium]
MQQSRKRILTTHTGSLPRPPDLDQMLFDQERGRPVAASVVESRVREVVVETVGRQLDGGLDVVNDGEAGKIGFFNYVKERLTGFEGETIALEPAEMVEFPEVFERLREEPAYANLKLPSCNGPIEVRDTSAVLTDIANLKAALTGREPVEAFMNAASPGLIADTLGNTYYPDHEAYLYALADAMRYEYDAIVGAGFVLQVDSPDLAAFRAVGDNADLSEEEFRERVRLHVDALNHALRDLPPDRMRLHFCWGNTELPHLADIPLERIVDIVLEARPAGLSFAAANPRHEHEWRIWDSVELPEGKVLIPGVVDTTTNYVEHPELVAQRIVRYAKTVGKEHVIAGTDCGFGSLAGLYPVAPKVAWLKLRAMAEGARIASEQLW